MLRSGLLFTEHSDPIAVTQEFREIRLVLDGLIERVSTIERAVMRIQVAMLEAGLIDEVDDLGGGPTPGGLGG